jgi:hypothetical protein
MNCFSFCCDAENKIVLGRTECETAEALSCRQARNRSQAQVNLTAERAASTSTPTPTDVHPFFSSPPLPSKPACPDQTHSLAASPPGYGRDRRQKRPASDGDLPQALGETPRPVNLALANRHAALLQCSGPLPRSIHNIKVHSPRRTFLKRAYAKYLRATLLGPQRKFEPSRFVKKCIDLKATTTIAGP